MSLHAVCFFISSATTAPCGIRRRTAYSPLDRDDDLPLGVPTLHVPVHRCEILTGVVEDVVRPQRRHPAQVPGAETAVTSAPKTFASCTAKCPIPPDAP